PRVRPTGVPASGRQTGGRRDRERAEGLGEGAVGMTEQPRLSDEPGEGGIVGELERMSPAERAAHEAAVAEAVAADREVEVEFGDTLLEMREVTMKFGGLTA